MDTHFYAFGASHHTTPIDLRERLAVPPELQPRLMQGLLSAGLAQEVAVLNTCNRVECYCSAVARSPLDDLIQVLAAATGQKTLPSETFYLHEGEDALRHLFRVASSLDSLVVGETHILGQVKACYETARLQNTAGKWLNIFFQKSFQVAKKIRSETSITALPVSVGSCAVTLVERVFGLSNISALLVGTGSTGENVARHFAKHGVELTFCNRTRSRAERIASELGGNVIDFSQWKAHLKRAQVVVFATQSRSFLLEAKEARTLLPATEPLLILDLGVPRNVEGEVGESDSVFLFDVDSVQGIVKAHYQVRLREAERAEKIVFSSAERLWQSVHFPLRRRLAAAGPHRGSLT